MSYANFYQNRTAIVTGAGSGIGRSLALELAGRGARIAATDIDEKRVSDVVRELRAGGASATAYCFDQSKQAQVRKFRQDFLTDFSRADILCLNAGVMHSAEFAETTIADWQRMLNVNLWGPIYLLQEFLQDAKDARPGGILLTASLAGLIGFPSTSAYSASKFAMRALGESLRAELRRDGVRVSVLCPGIVRTNLVRAGTVRLESQGVGADSVDKYWQKIGEEPADVARKALDGLAGDVAVISSSPLFVGFPWALKRYAGEIFSKGSGLFWQYKDRLSRNGRGKGKGTHDQQAA